ncbi:MAG TPA: DUF402 domain-containing protein [Micromonosporaceae bacterium]|nr:DUF402 domain-containing protein [Micromonosporaceae bacterium]
MGLVDLPAGRDHGRAASRSNVGRSNVGRFDVGRFDVGRTVLRRDFRDDTIVFMQAARVIADDDRGLLLWYPAGTTFWRIIDRDGRTVHDAPLDRLAEPRLVALTWQGSDVAIFMPRGASHSVWWFFAADSGDFQGWYGNLETPYVRWDDGDVCGVDSVDQALDLRIAPDGTWSWKDADEFDALTGKDGYWTADEAAAIRDEGERLARLAETSKFPFDGTWCDFTPDSSWPIPQRPAAGWDRPRAR